MGPWRQGCNKSYGLSVAGVCVPWVESSHMSCVLSLAHSSIAAWCVWMWAWQFLIHVEIFC